MKNWKGISTKKRKIKENNSFDRFILQTIIRTCNTICITNVIKNSDFFS